MHGLSDLEVTIIDGGSLAFSIGHDIGKAVGCAVRGALEYIYNEPFLQKHR